MPTTSTSAVARADFSRPLGPDTLLGVLPCCCTPLALPASRSGAAPTPLGLADLSELTRSVAAQVRTGAHDVVLDPHQRWYRRLYADPFVDVWLISWAVEQATELHDHAGSLGALTVVSGELQEQRWVPAERALRTRRLRAGKGATFALGHVHDVVNSEPAHAVSVHAYSPPLTAMSYYAVDAGGRPAAHPHGAHHGRLCLRGTGDDHGGRPARRGPRPAGPGRPATGRRAGGATARCSSTPARSGSATTRARCPARW